jgi:transglutaminase-like putative cysteine protease
VLKLYQKKTARDWRQLMVVSLMHAGVAAIVTTELVFLPSFLLYCGVATVAVVLLHLQSLAGGEESPDRPAPAACGPLARCAPRLAVASLGMTLFGLAVALVIFLTCPRVPFNVLNTKVDKTGDRFSGFSDRVRLGDIGSIIENPARVMRVILRRNGEVVTGSGTRLLWRGVALSEYDGTVWHADRVVQPVAWELGARPRLLQQSRPPQAEGALEQDIVLQPTGTRTLFALYPPVWLPDAGPEGFACDWTLGLARRRREPGAVHYRVFSRPVEPDAARLRAAVRGRDMQALALYTDLPELSPRIAALARDVAPAERFPTDWDKAAAVERWLKANCSYTLRPDATPGVEPVEDFLVNLRRGNCEYFAASMVVMLRTLGVPARLVNGFAGGEWNSMGEFYVVRQSDAHSWVEVYFGKERGWAAFDPTPSVRRIRAYGGGLLATIKELLDVVRIQWLVYVVRYDRTDQARLAGRAATAAGGLLRSMRHGARLRLRGPDDMGRRLALPAGIVLVVGGLLALAASTRGGQRLRRFLPGAAGGGEGAAAYRSAEALLARRRWVRRPGETPMEFADGVSRRDPESGDALARICRAFCRERYGGIAVTAEEAAALRAALGTLRARRRVTGKA